MFTDRLPRKAALRAQFEESDRLVALEIPFDRRLQEIAQSIAGAMEAGKLTRIQDSCAEFLLAAARFYGVRTPSVRALAARPVRVREGGWAVELFGDYTLRRAAIRVWTKTAVRRQMTSFGTFFSTLCHEFCHHLDCERFGFRTSPHTRGFYERTAILYHHARGTPRKRLVWASLPGGRWRIDWQRTNARAKDAGNGAVASASTSEGIPGDFAPPFSLR